MMGQDAFNRRSLCAVVAGSFAAVAITGVLMLFHVKNGVIVTVHEWIGLLFTIAAVIHLVVHWKAFLTYLKRKDVRLALGLTIALIVLLGIIGGGHRSPHHRARRGHSIGTDTPYNGVRAPHAQRQHRFR